MKKPIREHLVDTAMDLFYQHGFHAVGVDRIYHDAGTTKTTLYNHFESKDSLICAVIEKRDAWWRETFRHEIQRLGGNDPVDQLRAVFSVLRAWFDTLEFKGCLFINAAAAFPSPREPAHQAAKANIDAIRGIITELAEQAGMAQPHAFAAKFNLIIEGAIITEVIDRNHDAAMTACELGELLIQKSLPRAVA